MVKKRKTRARARQAASQLAGVFSSATRTLTKTPYVATTGAYILASSSTKVADQISALLTKLEFADLAKWVTEHQVKTLAMVYIAVAVILTAPNSTALVSAAVGAYIIYALKTPTKRITWEYAILTFGVCWFARTRSSRIRTAIVVVYLAIYCYGQWGQSFL